MILSKRLSAIASMVPKCECIADIGTDHGYLPIELVKQNKCQKAYAMDINKGPLDKADENIIRANESGKVKTILSNGLDKLPEDVECVVIAGMGGMLIGKILETNNNKLNQLSSFIVSPHLDEASLRRTIHRLGYRIDSEIMIHDLGKYYPIMYCLPGHEEYTEVEYTYGKCLMEDKSDVWCSYLDSVVEKNLKILSFLEGKKGENIEERIKMIKKENNLIRAIKDGEMK